MHRTQILHVEILGIPQIFNDDAPHIIWYNGGSRGLPPVKGLEKFEPLGWDFGFLVLLFFCSLELVFETEFIDNAAMCTTDGQVSNRQQYVIRPLPLN